MCSFSYDSWSSLFSSVAERFTTEEEIEEVSITLYCIL